MIKRGQLFSRKIPTAGAGDAHHTVYGVCGTLWLRFPAHASRHRRMVRGKGQDIGQDLPHAILIPQHSEGRRLQGKGEMLTPLLDLWAYTLGHVADERV